MRTLVNRLVVLVVGAALAAVGVVAIVEAVATGVGAGFVWFPGQAWLRTLETTSWANPTVLIVAIIVGVVGLLLLVIQLAPRRRRTAPVSAAPGRWHLARRSGERHLERLLAEEPSTSGVKVHLRPHHHTWTVAVRLRSGRAQPDALRQRVSDELGRLGAPGSPRIKIKAKSQGSTT